VDQIYGYSGLSSFQDDWRITPQQWRETIANQSYATSEYLQPFADQYATEWRVWAASVGLSPATPGVLGDYNVTVHMPGQDMVGIVIDDVIECRRSLDDCGKVLDDTSTALSATSMGCAMAGFGPCAGITSLASTGVSVAGTVITVYDHFVTDEASRTDVGVAGVTTTVGGFWGGKGKGTVGLLLSVFQWRWDH